MNRLAAPAPLDDRTAARGSAAEFDLAGVLDAFNPWWHGSRSPPLPASPELPRLIELLRDQPPAVLTIEGPRQTGKSTLLDALPNALLESGVAPGAVCRLRFETGPLRWSDPGWVEHAWSARWPGVRDRHAWLLIDDFGEWAAQDRPHDAQARLIDTLRGGRRTLVVTGCDLAAAVDGWRSAGLRVARLRLATRNFAAFLAAAARSHVSGVPAALAAPRTLRELFDWPDSRFAVLRAPLQVLAAQFQDYLWRGGYPGTQEAASLSLAQQHLRDGPVMRALRWDAPALQGVRRGRDLEHALDHLAARAGSLLDVPELCRRLTVERPTVRHFLDLLEASGLLIRIPPLGYGVRVQRARFLVGLGDPGLIGSLLWQGPASGASAQGDGARLQSALLRHLRGAYGARGGRISYAQAGRRASCLMVSAGESQLVFGLPDAPAGAALRTSARELDGLARICRAQGLERAYLATCLSDDIGLLHPAADTRFAVMRIPAALLCLWLAAAEPSGIESDA